MSKIVSIGTAVPPFAHQQEDILSFMQTVYAGNDVQRRKMKYLYHNSGINTRYSFIPDYSKPTNEWRFFPQTEHLEPFPSLEQRLQLFNRFAPQLTVDAIRNCLGSMVHNKSITHLITVSCTGMSAPGLDLQVMDMIGFNKNIFRTSINFMGCYAAIHALKLADALCKAEPDAQVVIVCTELCTLHFQQETTPDNIMSSLLFGDGAAAVLVNNSDRGLTIESFYSEVLPKGKRDMAWELSSNGFLMTLSSYVPDLIEEDFKNVTDRALQQASTKVEDVSDWCIHPGGKRILEAVQKALALENGSMDAAYHVLQQFGNMSSATLLFVLKEIMHRKTKIPRLFCCSFWSGTNY